MIEPTGGKVQACGGTPLNEEYKKIHRITSLSMRPIGLSDSMIFFGRRPNSRASRVSGGNSRGVDGYAFKKEKYICRRLTAEAALC